MKIEKNNYDELMDAVDMVCMYCIMDTNNSSPCDCCPVRKTCKELEIE